MIILLTGKPGVGKSVLLQELIALYQASSVWITTARLPNPSGDGGLGFIATNSFGKVRIVSHKTDIQSDIVVGRNHVDIAAVDEMFLPVIKEATKLNNEMVFIDEIGPIELASLPFESLLPKLFDTHRDMVAVVHAVDERLEEYRCSQNTLLVEVILDNRDTLAKMLLSIIINRHSINELTEVQQIFVNKLLLQYIVEYKVVQLKKLMEHATQYVIGNKIEQVEATHWVVEGYHGNYNVASISESFSCTCDLFNGKNKYINSSGECSHIQAVRIVQAV